MEFILGGRYRCPLSLSHIFFFLLQNKSPHPPPSTPPFHLGVTPFSAFPPHSTTFCTFFSQNVLLPVSHSQQRIHFFRLYRAYALRPKKKNNQLSELQLEGVFFFLDFPKCAPQLNHFLRFFLFKHFRPFFLGCNPEPHCFFLRLGRSLQQFPPLGVGDLCVLFHYQCILVFCPWLVSCAVVLSPSANPRWHHEHGKSHFFSKNHLPLLL